MTDEEIGTAYQTPEMAALINRYHAAAHRMQTGVAIELQMPDREHAASRKHLRVGVNSAMVDASAIALVLMRKGIITPLEYMEALAQKMEEEAAVYERRINDAHGGGNRIKLG